jgi:transcriptional regulator with XRE-family HTH domain
LNRQATGFSYAAVRKWERGKRQPRLSSLVRLAEALGVSLQALRGRAEVRRQGPRRGRGE